MEDAMKETRRMRDLLNEQIKHMSNKEILRYIEKKSNKADKILSVKVKSSSKLKRKAS